MKLFVIILICISFAYGDKMITIVSYNVENLFDLKKSGYEYTEYIPNTNAKWNQKNFNIKSHLQIPKNNP